MKARTILATAAITISAAFASSASAATPTEVTIKGQNGDYYGFVKSSDPANCAEGRKVTVYKMLGSSPAPKADQKIGSDTAGFNGSKYEWSIGNSGYKHGSFYAKVRKTDMCGGATSKVIVR